MAIRVNEPFPVLPILIGGAGAVALVIVLSRIRKGRSSKGPRTPPPKTDPGTPPPKTGPISSKEENWIPEANGKGERHPETASSERASETASAEEVSETPPVGTVKRTPERVVNTGFASHVLPDTPIDQMTPLKPNEDYYFWLDIGKPAEGSIETNPSDIPEVPENALLVVTIFGFKDGIETRESAHSGKLDVLPEGRVKVFRQPIGRKGDQPHSKLLEDRLFFPVHTPKKSGTYELRCNIYHKQFLLQSRLIHAVVATRRTGDQALRSDLDYTLMQTFDARDIKKFDRHKLSIFLNQNTDASHTFYIVGEKKDVSINVDAGELKTLLGTARGSLRIASWGSEEKWNKEGYRHQGDYDTKKEENREEKLNRLKKDLWNMAFFGKTISDKLDLDEIETLRSHVPAYIQVAPQENKAKMMFPAALIYGYLFDKFYQEKIEFCPEFESAFLNNKPLEKTACFQGHCPSMKKYLESKREVEDRRWLCPSGFWGFRHYLGMPLSVGKEEEDKALPSIPVNKEMHISVAFAQDLPNWEDHYRFLEKLFHEKDPRSDWKNARNRKMLPEC